MQEKFVALLIKISKCVELHTCSSVSIVNPQNCFFYCFVVLQRALTSLGTLSPTISATTVGPCICGPMLWGENLLSKGDHGISDSLNYATGYESISF